jgi:hypothetical protein
MNRFEDDPPDVLSGPSLLRWVRRAAKQRGFPLLRSILFPLGADRRGAYSRLRFAGTLCACCSRHGERH